MIRTVATDKAHVKMMTVGEKDRCDVCGGTVTVVATGKGKGKDAEVKHVCSKCGDDAMFCSATKPGGGSMKDLLPLAGDERGEDGCERKGGAGAPIRFRRYGFPNW